jgi:hypothetical protein
MEDAVQQTKKQPRRERVTLDPVAITRLDECVNQVQLQLKGVRLTRSDLVNFLVLQHPEGLSSAEIQILKTTHFDEAEFAEWALKEFRRAKERGENPSLADILKPVLPSAPKKVRKRKYQGAEKDSLPNDF